MEILLEQQKLKKIRKKSKKRSAKYTYLIVIDFEATCFEKPFNRNKQEIIEFPAVLLNLTTGKIEKEFHKYLRPVEIPVLSEYCEEYKGNLHERIFTEIYFRH